MIALRVAAIEARCWAANENTTILDNDGTKIKEARIKAINKKYDEAEVAIQFKHSTYDIGKWQKCRHCPAKCLARNSLKFWTKKPCHRAFLNKMELPTGGWKETVERYKLFDEADKYKMNSDSDEAEPGEDGGEEEAEEVLCSVCSTAENETSIYNCQECKVTICIICEQQEKCFRCLKDLCNPCYIRHVCATSSSRPPTAPTVEVPVQVAAPEQVEAMPASTVEAAQHTRSRLDDPEIGDFFEDEPHEQEPLQEEEQGPPEDEAYPDQVEGPARKRLRMKTPAEQTVYEVRRKRRKDIDYDAVREATGEVKKRRRLEYETTVAKQPRIDQTVQLTTQSSRGGWGNIHGSHRRAMVNQIIFCYKCGLYSVNKAEGLAQQCKGQPANSFGRAQLKKLTNGKIQFEML